MVPDQSLISSISSTEHSRLEDETAGYNKVMFNSVFHAPVNAPETILDIGCGTGAVTYNLTTSYPSAQVYGLEISPVPDLRPEQPNITFVQGTTFVPWQPAMIASAPRALITSTAVFWSAASQTGPVMCGW